MSRWQEYCFDTGLSDNGCVDAVDFYCQCPKSDTLIAGMTPCLLNLCSSLEMTQAVIYWQTLCMLAVSSVVEVPGFATDSMGLAKNPTMAVPKTTAGGSSLSVPTTLIPTFAPSLDSLLSEFSFLASRTSQLGDYLVSEADSIGTSTGASQTSGSSSSESSPSSLSTGAKAGIAVGVVGVAVAVGLGAWLFCRRRRRTRAAAPAPYIGRDEGFSEKISVTATTQQVEPTKHPSSPIQRKPVQISQVYPEMDGRSAVSPVNAPGGLYGHELEGQYWPAAHEERRELPS